MPLTRDYVLRAHELLTEAERIICVCHANPDGDAIGSLLSLGELLHQAYENKVTSLHCQTDVPDTFSFLRGLSRVSGSPEVHDGDCVIFLDCGDPKLTEMQSAAPKLFDGSIPSINIDHHPDNPMFGTVNLVDPHSSSTCQLILEIAQILSWHISTDCATSILTGIYTDTGGLLHSNTSSHVYRAVSLLLRKGASLQDVINHIFRSVKLSTVKLWGRVLEKIDITESGGAIAAVMAEDFRASGALHSELSGAIDYVNAIPGMRFSLILSERDGKVKGSLRTLREDVDVSKMAMKFQGGGHRKAAGFSLKGKLKSSVRWTVVSDDEHETQELPVDGGAAAPFSSPSTLSPSWLPSSPGV